MTSVSVIIPAYGEPKYLEETCRSVFRQTDGDWELIVVDDNDPDTSARAETEKCMAPFLEDGRVRYLKHPCNKNGAAARNTGLASARGQYVSFLDSDDFYLPRRLERCRQVMDAADEKTGGVYTGCEFRRGGRPYHVLTGVKSGNFLTDTLATTFQLGTGSNLFIRRHAAVELGGFDESFRRHQDYEFLVRFFQKYDLAGLDEVLVVKNNENINAPDLARLIALKEQYREKFSSVIASLPEKDQNRILHAHHIQVAEAAMRAGNRAAAREYYSRAIASAPLTVRERARKLAFTASCAAKKGAIG